MPDRRDMTDHALRQVGKRMTWDRYEPTRRHVEGVCDRVEPTFSTISNERGSFPGVRFRIKPDDGSRAVWTDTFADEGDLPEDARDRAEVTESEGDHRAWGLSQRRWFLCRCGQDFEYPSDLEAHIEEAVTAQTEENTNER